MTLFAPPMNMTCELVVSSRNRFGDWVYGSEATVSCHFREISTVRRGSNMEINDSDAMLWVPAGTSIDSGSMVKFDGKFYEVQRTTDARRLSEATVQFIKCDLKRVVLVS